MENLYTDIEVETGTVEGYPTFVTITTEDQKFWVESGSGTVKDLIDLESKVSSFLD